MAQVIKSMYFQNGATAVANSSDLGGICIGYGTNANNLPLVLNASNQAYISIPTDIGWSTNFTVGLNYAGSPVVTQNQFSYDTNTSTLTIITR